MECFVVWNIQFNWAPTESLIMNFRPQRKGNIYNEIKINGEFKGKVFEILSILTILKIGNLYIIKNGYMPSPSEINLHKIILKSNKTLKASIPITVPFAYNVNLKSYATKTKTSLHSQTDI